MSFVNTKGVFNVGLDGVGLMLQGSPAAPGYRMTNAPVYGTRFASGDRDYNDLSQWWYLIQTDWSGGFKEKLSFEDDAKFYYSSNIDVRTKPGSLRLEHDIALERDNTSNAQEVLAVITSIVGGNDRTHYIDNDDVRRLSNGNVVWDSDGSNPSTEVGRGDYEWTFGDAVVASNGTSFPLTASSKTSQINGIIDGSIGADGVSGLVIGSTLYVAGVSDADKLFLVKTTVASPSSGADWTLVAETPFGNSLGGKLAGMVHYGGEILFLIAGEPQWGLYSYDISANTLSEVRQFDGGVQIGIYYKGARYIQKFLDVALITICKGGNDDEDGDIWEYNGSTLTKIYTRDESKIGFSTREAKPWLRGGCVVHGDNAFWGNLVYDGESFFNFIKSISDDPDEVAIPVGSDGAYLYLVDNVVVSGDDQLTIYAYDQNGTAYKDGASNSAFVVFSQHDKLQSIDKLLNSINIGFEPLASGQAISVYYSTEPVPDPDITTGGWELLGTASYTLDGGSVTYKTLNFPVGTTAKKVWFRVELSAGGTDTPTVSDFTLEYLPMPDYKKQWALNVNCADELKTLSGRLTELTARELKGRLERAWWTKSALDFADLDYAATAVNDASMTSTATTVTVDSTVDFPEQGRIRIDDEEIIYTGKTPTTFTGCTRGARGTRASTHADDSTVHNGYRVLVTDIDVRAPILLEDKHLEYIVGISLREV